jgi:AcrR family transcriptional regulator
MARPHADATLLRRVVVAVFELVAEHGVDGASMRRVAARTGLSTGTLNYHFENKAGLLEAALDYAYREPLDWPEHAKDARRGLTRLLRRYVLRRREVRDWWRFWCAVTAQAAKDRRIAARQKKNQLALVAFFAKVIGSGVARGELRRGLDPEREAERLVALAHGLALRQLVDGGPSAVRVAEALLAAEVKRLA